MTFCRRGLITPKVRYVDKRRVLQGRQGIKLLCGLIKQRTTDRHLLYYITQCKYYFHFKPL